MKLLALIIMFIAVSTSFNSRADQYSITVTNHTAYQALWSDWDSSDTTAIELGLRRGITENVFISLNYTDLSAGPSGASQSGLYTANVGYKTLNKLYFEYSVGLGHLDRQDSYLNNSRQFNLSAGVGYKVTPDVNAVFKVAHVSSCAQICGFNEREVNKGREYIGFQFEIKL